MPLPVEIQKNDWIIKPAPKTERYSQLGSREYSTLFGPGSSVIAFFTQLMMVVIVTTAQKMNKQQRAQRVQWRCCVFLSFFYMFIKNKRLSYLTEQMYLTQISSPLRNYSHSSIYPPFYICLGTSKTHTF